MMRKKGQQGKYKKNVGALWRALHGVQYTPDSLLDRIRLQDMMAIDALVRGQGTAADVSIIVGMFTLCEYIGKQGIGDGIPELIAEAEPPMQAAIDRYTASGRLTLTGPCIAAIKRVYVAHDQQRVQLTRKQYEQMLDGCQQYINRARASVRKDAKRSGTLTEQPAVPLCS